MTNRLRHICAAIGTGLVGVALLGGCPTAEMPSDVSRRDSKEDWRPGRRAAPPTRRSTMREFTRSSLSPCVSWFCRPSGPVAEGAEPGLQPGEPLGRSTATQGLPA